MIICFHRFRFDSEKQMPIWKRRETKKNKEFEEMITPYLRLVPSNE